MRSSSGIHVLVLMHEVPDHDTSMSTLAEVLDLGLYEARARHRAIRNGPVVVGTYASYEDFERRAQALRAAGFAVLALDEAQLAGEDVLIANTFELTDTHFRAAEYSRTIDLGFADIELILAATAVASVTRRDTKLYRPPGAIAFGGIAGALARSTKTVERTDEVHGPILRLYSRVGPVIELRSGNLAYTGLGQEIQATRAANFRTLHNQLRVRCPDALADDRLTVLSRTKQLLGPSMSTELHLGIAMTILARALRTTAEDPFRPRTQDR